MGIGWIPAYSPQAKGRVERSFGTDQDRLVKQLRLAKVKTMEEANQFLEKEYWPEWNERFARPLEGVVDLHRALTPQIDLASALSHVEQRVISNDYTFSFAGRKLPDCSERGEGRNEGQEPANRTASERRAASAIRRAVCGTERVRRQDSKRQSRWESRAQRSQSRRQERLDGGLLRTPGPELWQAVARRTKETERRAGGDSQ